VWHGAGTAGYIRRTRDSRTNGQAASPPCFTYSRQTPHQHPPKQQALSPTSDHCQRLPLLDGIKWPDIQQPLEPRRYVWAQSRRGGGKTAALSIAAMASPLISKPSLTLNAFILHPPRPHRWARVPAAFTCQATTYHLRCSAPPQRRGRIFAGNFALRCCGSHRISPRTPLLRPYHRHGHTRGGTDRTRTGLPLTWWTGFPLPAPSSQASHAVGFSHRANITYRVYAGRARLLLVAFLDYHGTLPRLPMPSFACCLLTFWQDISTLGSDRV